MGKIKKELAVRANWTKIKELTSASDWNCGEISALVGKSRTWLTDGIAKGRMADINDLKTLAMLFKVDVLELIIEEPKEEPKPEKKEDQAVLHKVMELEAKIDKLVELLAKLSEPKKKNEDDPRKLTVKEFIGKSKRELAKMLLTEMVEEGYGKVIMTTFMKEMLKLNIPSSYAEQAVKDCGYEKGTTGYGNNAVTWVIDKYYEGVENGK